MELASARSTHAVLRILGRTGLGRGGGARMPPFGADFARVGCKESCVREHQGRDHPPGRNIESVVQAKGIHQGRLGCPVLRMWCASSSGMC